LGEARSMYGRNDKGIQPERRRPLVRPGHKWEDNIATGEVEVFGLDSRGLEAKPCEH